MQSKLQLKDRSILVFRQNVFNLTCLKNLTKKSNSSDRIEKRKKVREEQQKVRTERERARAEAAAADRQRREEEEKAKAIEEDEKKKAALAAMACLGNSSRNQRTRVSFYHF